MPCSAPPTDFLSARCLGAGGQIVARRECLVVVLPPRNDVAEGGLARPRGPDHRHLPHVAACLARSLVRLSNKS